MKENKKIIIIGAGISGLACAYNLIKKGHRNIEIFEASTLLGGRCRAYFDDNLQTEIDNGNHLILKCNKNIFKIINDLNLLDKFNYFHKKIFNFYDAKDEYFYNFKPPFFSGKDFGRLATAKMLAFILFAKKSITVAKIFKKHDKLYNKLINPISRSILNTDSAEASADILKNVFRKIIFSKNGFDAYYPKSNWRNSIIEPLAEYLKNNDVKIYFNQSLKSFTTEDDKIAKLNFNNIEIDSSESIIISAVPSSVAHKIFKVETPDSFESIINIHFKFLHNIEAGFVGIINSNVEWIFVKPEIVSTTYSAANSLKIDDEKLALDTWQIICKIYKLNSAMPNYKIIKEKRATFKCNEEQLKKRPSNKTQYKNLFLCGDYVQNQLPSTLEGSVLNGFNAIESPISPSR